MVFKSQTTKSHFCVSIFAAIFLAGWSILTPTYAAPVTFDFTGNVTSQVGTTHGIGSQITGTFTFDSAATGITSSGATQADYSSAVSNFSIAEFQSVPGGAGPIEILDNHPFPNPPGSMQEAFVARYTDSNGTFTFDLDVIGSNPTAVNSLALPQSPYPLGPFDFKRFSFDNHDISTPHIDMALFGDITSVTLVQDVTPSVPEPSTWAMMILGFAGIGFMAYRRKQNGLRFV